MSSVDVRLLRRKGLGELCAFYINRDRDVDRRGYIERELARVGLSGQRIDAVDGVAVPDELRPYFFTSDTQSTRLSAGEVGCYASHLKAARAMLVEGLAYALVIEDDAVLPQSAARELSDILSAAPAGWDLIHLCNEPTHAFKRLRHLPSRRDLVCYSRTPPGAIGYLLSAAGARKLLKPTLRQWPIDTDFRQPWEFGLNIYGVVPRLIFHNDALKSALLEYGDRSRLRRGIRRPSLKYPLGNPLHTPKGGWFNFRRLGPAWWVRCLAVNLFRRLQRVKPRQASYTLDLHVRSQHR